MHKPLRQQRVQARALPLVARLQVVVQPLVVQQRVLLVQPQPAQPSAPWLRCKLWRVSCSRRRRSPQSLATVPLAPPAPSKCLLRPVRCSIFKCHFGWRGFCCLVLG